MHQQPKPLPMSKRIIRDTSSQTPFSAEEFRLARGAYRAWENVSIQNALKAVDKGEPVHRAAELYNVPLSTLFDFKSSGSIFVRRSDGNGPRCH